MLYGCHLSSTKLIHEFLIFEGRVVVEMREGEQSNKEQRCLMWEGGLCLKCGRSLSGIGYGGVR